MPPESPLMPKSPVKPKAPLLSGDAIPEGFALLHSRLVRVGAIVSLLYMGAMTRVDLAGGHAFSVPMTIQDVTEAIERAS